MPSLENWGGRLKSLLWAQLSLHTQCPNPPWITELLGPTLPTHPVPKPPHGLLSYWAQLSLHTQCPNPPWITELLGPTLPTHPVPKPSHGLLSYTTYFFAHTCIYIANFLKKPLLTSILIALYIHTVHDT